TQKIIFNIWLSWPGRNMTHPNSAQIRKSRFRLLITRIFLLTGIGLIIYDYYLTFLTPYWNFKILLTMFITGCALIIIAFTGKFWRLGTSRSSKNGISRHGECVNCGACCRMPVRCVFLFRNKCMIHRNRPKQCREFPSKPVQLVSHSCGYWFEPTK
ncbi:MAG: YkgJ family cysteine cluster protein, partial [Thermoplasmata archaeon]|nr:YkgJ family cysteine cluster protein [Thermoplasmata archaeon]